MVNPDTTKSGNLGSNCNHDRNGNAEEASGETYVYQDFANEPITSLSGRTFHREEAPPLSLQSRRLPSKLSAMLSNPDLVNVICWMGHGRSWKVINRELFVEIVLPAYFGHTKYASFVRIVNAWGFRRITTGNDRDSYYHELFLRGKPHLHERMKRLPACHRKAPVSEKEKNPNFSKMPPLPEVPRDALALRNALSLSQDPRGSNALQSLDVASVTSVPSLARASTTTNTMETLESLSLGVSGPRSLIGSGLGHNIRGIDGAPATNFSLFSRPTNNTDQLVSMLINNPQLLGGDTSTQDLTNIEQTISMLQQLRRALDPTPTQTPRDLLLQVLSSAQTQQRDSRFQSELIRRFQQQPTNRSNMNLADIIGMSVPHSPDSGSLLNEMLQSIILDQNTQQRHLFSQQEQPLIGHNNIHQQLIEQQQALQRNTHRPQSNSNAVASPVQSLRGNLGSNVSNREGSEKLNELLSALASSHARKPSSVKSTHLPK